MYLGPGVWVVRGEGGDSNDGEATPDGGLSRRDCVKVAAAAVLPLSGGVDHAVNPRSTADERVRYGQNEYGDRRPI